MQGIIGLLTFPLSDQSCQHCVRPYRQTHDQIDEYAYQCHAASHCRKCIISRKSSHDRYIRGMEKGISFPANPPFSMSISFVFFMIKYLLVYLFLANAVIIYIILCILHQDKSPSKRILCLSKRLFCLQHHFFLSVMTVFRGKTIPSVPGEDLWDPSVLQKSLSHYQPSP